MIKQLAHACLYSRDVQAMVRFYSEKLGLPIAFTMQDEQGQDVGWYLGCGQMTFVEIFSAEFAESAWGNDVSGMDSVGRLRHLCFEVDDIEQTARELAERGVEVFNQSVGMDHSKQGWVIDPDGNWIELMEYTPASLQLG